MRRLRGNGGQTTVEWLVLMAGVVALAAVLVTSLPNVAGAITDRFGCVVSSVVDHGSCPAGPRSTDRPRPGGERRIYDADGHLIREEGDDPSGDPEADAVYDNFGRIYDYYMGKFGRNSYDDMRAPLIGTVNYPPACSGGAYWSPSQKQMYFCPGFAGPLDVTAHEVTHA